MSRNHAFQNLTGLAKFGFPVASVRKACRMSEDRRCMLVRGVARCKGHDAVCKRSPLSPSYLRQAHQMRPFSGQEPYKRGKSVDDPSRDARSRQPRHTQSSPMTVALDIRKKRDAGELKISKQYSILAMLRSPAQPGKWWRMKKYNYLPQHKN